MTPHTGEGAKKKLLVVTSTFPRWKDDPKPSFVWELSRRLTGVFDVYVLAPHFPGAQRKEAIDGITVYRFQYFIPKFETLTDMGGILSALARNKLLYFQLPFLIVSELAALLRYARIIRPDVIHAHWIIPQGFLAYLSFKIFHIPYIITSHGSDIFGIKGLNFIKKLSLKHSKGVTAVSRDIKRKIMQDIDASLGIDVIPMGVDTRRFRPRGKDEDLLRKFDIKGYLLLFVGRLSPEKGLRGLIEAMPDVAREFPDIKLLIVGDGDQKNALRALSRQKKLGAHVVFVNRLSNKELPAYYASADAFICPSFREGAPVTYIEALACGTPIIVGDLPVSREIVGKNRGILVKQNDPRDISAKIIRFLKNKKDSDNDLHRFVRDHYDWTVINQRFLNVLTR